MAIYITWLKCTHIGLGAYTKLVGHKKLCNSIIEIISKLKKNTSSLGYT